MVAPKLVFIVPYRDRVHHKQFFTKYIEFILEDYKKGDYEIFFSHHKSTDFGVRHRSLAARLVRLAGRVTWVGFLLGFFGIFYETSNN